MEIQKTTKGQVRGLQRKVNDLFPRNEVEVPDATHGECRRCGQLKELGDGFCMKCWDRGSNKNKQYKIPNAKQKAKELRNRRHYYKDRPTKI